MKNNNINIKNKKASFDYEFLSHFTAGMVLVGPEIKSIREGKVNLTDSFCLFENHELWAKNIQISTYDKASYNSHQPKRDRKLLLNKKELRKLEREIEKAGVTIVPTSLFINENGLAKLNIALARGKKEYDKRQSIKEREDLRQMSYSLKKSY